VCSSDLGERLEVGMDVLLQQIRASHAHQLCVDLKEGR